MEKIKGIAYGVGVGPGDPELMTIKAVRLIRENEYIAVPGKKPRDTVAFKIAAGAVPEIENKTLLDVEMPMVRSAEELSAAHREGAARIKAILDSGENIVFLTLGDPSVYSTWGYLSKLLVSYGCRVETVSGVPSFCAAAAKLNAPLAEWDEQLRLIPAAHAGENDFSSDGAFVVMKSASRMADVKKALAAAGKTAVGVTNCGMEDEKLYASLDEVPDDAGYFTLLIAR